MMLRLFLTAATAVGLLIVLPWSAAADLDPAIQADLHLVQAEDYIEQKNYAAAQEAIGKFLALQKKHDLATWHQTTTSSMRRPWTWRASTRRRLTR